jgi:FlgN protein
MKELEAALVRQLELQQELLDLLKRETKELSEVHVDAMAEINNIKNELSLRITDHAPILKKAIQDVAVREGLSPGATLGDLNAKLRNNWNGGILRLYAELNVTADQIKELLSLNHEIAARFASSIGNSLDLISRIINQNSTYGASGSYQQRASSALLVNREA